MLEAPIPNPKQNLQDDERSRKGLTIEDLKTIKSGDHQPALTKNRKRSPWVAFFFSCFLALITLVGKLIATLLELDGNPANIAVICFFPMCFLYTGFALTNLQRENDNLRFRLEEIHRKLPADSSEL